MHKASFTRSWTGLVALSSTFTLLGVLPIDGVLLIPRMLSDGRLLSMPLAARVLVFFNPCFQPSLRLPCVNLTTLAGDLIDHSCQFLHGEGVLRQSQEHHTTEGGPAEGRRPPHSYFQAEWLPYTIHSFHLLYAETIYTTRRPR